eukprot:m.19606 g.19606  ORF g.19606 m.19606 type:complete len:592 (-) comp12540_c0_seq1:173-1948(-)
MVTMCTRTRTRVLLLTTILTVLQPQVAGEVSLKIAAFNVQTFGQSKVGKEEVVQVLIRIIQEHDLLIMQEVRDVSETAPNTLLDEVNKVSSIEYAMVLSKRFGVRGSSYLEQYAYFYQIDKMTPTQNMSWETTTSGDEWLFPRRSPHAVWWSVVGSDFTPITVVMHMSPDHVWQELDALGIAMDDIVSPEFPQTNEGVLLVGDFNADCSYLSDTRKECLRDTTCETYGQQRLFGEEFVWLIGDDVDTTTKATDCTYDRIIVSKSIEPIIAAPAAVVRFDLEYDLTYDQTIAVSDHYPVALTLALPPACVGGVYKRGLRVVASPETCYSSPTTSAPTTATGTWWQPKSSDALTWQWQIQGTVDTSFNVDMYDIDLFDNTAEQIQALKDDGRIVVCYFSAGTFEGWRPDWQQYFPFITSETYSGNQLPFAGKMADWDERWLDIREIGLLTPIMRARLQLAKDKGCDAVEPDNMDAYTNGGETGIGLTSDDQLAYNRWLATEAHAIGMSIGLKNDVDQLEHLVDYFDWALNEQCFQYQECGDYATYFTAQDKAVFGVEYSGSVSSFCPQAQSLGLSWLKKRLNLKAWRRGCEDF